MSWSIIDDNGSFQPSTDLNIERLLNSSSVTVQQEPSGLGVIASKQIDFGPALNSISDPVMLSADGTLTINVTGTYRIKTSLQFGRTGGTGESELLFRVLVNGNQAGASVSHIIDNARTSAYFENDTWIFLPAGTVIVYELMRDINGNNSGGLFGYTPTIDGGNEWNNAPSASIRVERWK